jgi:Skp family chaperone for outer membrane proteins
MKNHLKLMATCVLVSAMATAQAQTTAASGDATGKSTVPHRAARKVTPKRPSVETEIQQLREDMESQINQLKQQLNDSNAQLQAAQQQAAAANAAAAQAAQQAQQQQQQTTDNASAVSNLQGAVSDLKTNSTSLASSIQETQTNLTNKVEHPDAIHFKGITLSPTGSFIEAATVWRSAAIGGDINTQFTGIPLQFSNAAQLSEFYGTGRQSRIALKATGKIPSMTMTGYYEADWLGTGITSNNNQSNSYVFRQRQLWAQAALNNGWKFTGGQMWTLATETTKGLDNGTEILPAVIDPQYTAGFVWARQYGFRITKDFGDKLWIGASAENAETLNPGGSSLPTNLLIGSDGNNGGLYNVTANYSFNLAPDMIAKIAYEPAPWGHFEVFGIARFFRDRIYPNSTTTTTTVNGVTTTTTVPNSIGAYNDSTVGGGIGGSGRASFANKKFSVALKGLWGDGTGRYGSSTIADITLRPNAQIAPLHNFSALGTIEANPTKRMMLYVNYGGDYIGRRYFGKVGYGSPLTAMTGCNTEPGPSTAANPGFGGGTGFTPSVPANCGNQTKDVQELAAGYWYDFYRGPMGRLRQGAQYSYFQRNIWSGTGGPLNPAGGASGTDNAFWTSFRYYLP